MQESDEARRQTTQLFGDSSVSEFATIPVTTVSIAASAADPIVARWCAGGARQGVQVCTGIGHAGAKERAGLALS
jgi:hypothetical protein